MSDQKRPGRPKTGYVVIKIYGPLALRNYLDTVAKAQGLPDRSAAGRLILADAVGSSRFLDIDAVLAPEQVAA